MQFGWWSLLAFLALGFALEAMHGLKLGFYLDVSNDTRRFLWTLAHAHGALISILHLVFGLFAAHHDRWPAKSLTLASRCLVGAGVLMPLGFFLGGVVVYGGDPSPGIFLVPLGGALLLAAVFVTARAARSFRPEGSK